MGGYKEEEKEEGCVIELKIDTTDWHLITLRCFVVIFTKYTALFSCSENEAASTLSSLVDMPHQTRLVELLIASPEVSNQKILILTAT